MKKRPLLLSIIVLTCLLSLASIGVLRHHAPVDTVLTTDNVEQLGPTGIVESGAVLIFSRFAGSVRRLLTR